MKSELVDNNIFFNRRRFLSLSASAAIVLVGASIPTMCEASRFSKDLYKVSMSQYGMGTFINITVFDSSKAKAKDAIQNSYAEIDRLISILSRHDNSSEVSTLNRKGYLDGMSAELYDVLEASLYYNRLSSGYFDITILPLLNLYKKSFELSNRAPSNIAIENAKSYVGSEYVDLDKTSVKFKKENMQITLDSIAKGYIVDKAMSILKKHGIKHALINAGGDIALHGGSDLDRPWRIAIQDPKNKKRNIEVVEMMNGALATSGNYEIYFDKEMIYHHLISPFDANSMKEISSVSIKADTAMEADALATATFVMGTKKGQEFIDNVNSVEGLIVNNHNKKIITNSWYKA